MGKEPAAAAQPTGYRARGTMEQPLFPEVVARTDPGVSRHHNEDVVGFRVVPETNGVARAVLVVCDGMGGHPAGEVAAELGVRTVLEVGVNPRDASLAEQVCEALLAANAAILREGLRDLRKRGMGATCVAALLRGTELAVAHAGDCRAYLLSARGVRRLTSDHSWVGEQVRAGLLSEQQAHLSPFRSVVTRALGLDPTLQPEVRHTVVQPDEVVLLCSDGLWDVLDDETIRRVVVTASDLATAAEQLITLANARGGPDNISVMLARPASSATTEPPLPGEDALA